MAQSITSADEATLSKIRETLELRKVSKFVLLFSMGSQFDHLIVQTLDKLGVSTVVADPAKIDAEAVKKIAPTGIILSGGPASVESEPPPFDTKIFDLGIPTLGICLGFQMIAHHLGAPVESGHKREFGVHTFTQKVESDLFKDIPKESPVMQSHGDKIFASDTFDILGETDNAPVCAGHKGHLWGVQFHPEVTESKYGAQMYDNFCRIICGITERFPAEDVAAKKIAEIREAITDKAVIIALSGGSDSSVLAYLFKKAAEGINTRIRGVYIRGIDRPDDEANVIKYFGNQPWIEVKIHDATDDFLAALKGHTKMHDKRVAMRGIYKQVLEAEVKDFGADYISQGTLYTDLVESGHGIETGARRAQIKLHHNVNNQFSVPELLPLADCVKDSGRDIGRSIGCPEELLVRHPFPGPGLIVRIEGEVNAETLRVARAVDGIYIDELRKWNLYNTVWQAGAVVTRAMHTCTKGDDAAEGHVVAVWAVWSVNGFTAQFAELPYDFLRHVSKRMTNEIREVGAVVYRISDKPPATIEFG